MHKVFYKHTELNDKNNKLILKLKVCKFYYQYHSNVLC